MQDRLDNISNQGVNDRKKKKSLHDAVDTMHVSNWEERKSRRSSYYFGPNMDTIRKDSHTKRKVDKEMEDIVEISSSTRLDILERNATGSTAALTVTRKVLPATITRIISVR